MWSATIGYRDYRHPYLPAFFPAAAKELALTGKEALLDLGCGTGDVMLGFAPLVGSVTGMDLERPMLEEALKRANAQGRWVRLIHSGVEGAPEEFGKFDLITIGRAHWFMHNPATQLRLDRWLKPKGSILICMPVVNPAKVEWHNVYSAIGAKWARGNVPELIKLTSAQFFQGTDFVPVRGVFARGRRLVELEHLLYRALGTTATTREILGADADKMLAEIRTAMEPYFRNGPLIEPHLTQGLIYRRRGES